MLLRVWENALKAAAKFEGCEPVIATDDQRIIDFCNQHNGLLRPSSVNITKTTGSKPLPPLSTSAGKNWIISANTKRPRPLAEQPRCSIVKAMPFTFLKTLSRQSAKKKRCGRLKPRRRFIAKSDFMAIVWIFLIRLPNFRKVSMKSWKAWNSFAGLKTALKFVVSKSITGISKRCRPFPVLIRPKMSQELKPFWPNVVNFKENEL